MLCSAAAVLCFDPNFSRQNSMRFRVRRSHRKSWSLGRPRDVTTHLRYAEDIISGAEIGWLARTRQHELRQRRVYTCTSKASYDGD
jgi:hypothetical protein